MKVDVRCKCGKLLSLPSDMVGKRVRCPFCHAVFRLTLGDERNPSSAELEWIESQVEKPAVEAASVDSAQERTEPQQADHQPTAEHSEIVPQPALADWKLLLVRFGDWLLDCFLFYRKKRNSLAACLGDLIFRRDSDRIRLRIILSPKVRYRTASYSADGWSVQLPECCSVCGERSTLEPVEQTRKLDDLSMPIFGPVAGLLLGCAIAMTAGLWWPLLLCIVLGTIAGVNLRRTLAVELQYFRCPQHLKKRPLRAYLFVNNLSLLCRHKSVKQSFLRANRNEEDHPAEVIQEDQRPPSGPIGAVIGGIVWIIFGLFQVVEAAIELLAVFAAGFKISGHQVDTPGPLIVLFVIIGIYLLVRFSMAFTLCRAGWKAAQRDDENIVAHAIISILCSSIFLLPLWLILDGTWSSLPLPDSQALPFYELPGIWFPIGLGVSGVLLIVAGCLILWDEIRLSGQSGQYGAVEFITPCPACDAGFKARRGMRETLQACTECGEVFRVP